MPPAALIRVKRLIPKPFKFATSIINLDSKCNTHSKYNILYPRQFSILVSYHLIFTFLVSFWSAFTFLFTNTDSRKYTKILLYYPRHEGA